MMKKCILLYIILLPFFGFAQPSEVVIGEEHYAEILGEERSYYLSLPDSYTKDDFYVNKQYPVLVLLDGDAYFHATSGIVKAMSNGATEKIPELIVVAVRNTDRTRDMTPANVADGISADEGGSADFLRFL